MVKRDDDVCRDDGWMDDACVCFGGAAAAESLSYYHTRAGLASVRFAIS